MRSASGSTCTPSKSASTTPRRTSASPPTSRPRAARASTRPLPRSSPPASSKASSRARTTTTRRSSSAIRRRVGAETARAELRMRRWRGGDTVRRWAPVASWLLVISAFSTGWFTGEETGYYLLPILRWLFPSASYTQLVLAHHLVRKLAHFVEYLVLGVLLYRALDGAGFSPRTALRALALAALFAAGDEFHQSFVAGRTAAV